MKKKVIKKGDVSKKSSSKISPSPKTTPASKTSTSTGTKTATATKTSTDAYTQGNITVTGGAGKGSTKVVIGIPGGSLENNSKKALKAKSK